MKVTLYCRSSLVWNCFHRSICVIFCSCVCHITSETSCSQSTVAGHNDASRILLCLPLSLSAKLGQGHTETKQCLLVSCPGHTRSTDCLKVTVGDERNQSFCYSYLLFYQISTGHPDGPVGKDTWDISSTIWRFFFFVKGSEAVQRCQKQLRQEWDLMSHRTDRQCGV